MGREIRRVPCGWEHPRDERGNYIPLYDEEYGPAAQKWLAEMTAWENGTHEDIIKDPSLKEKYQHYWEWDGGPPDPDSYRPKFQAEPTCYQIYETVSEGTPTSPVFETLDGMANWLVTQGYSREAADGFVRDGYVPSMVIAGGRMYMGIESAGIPHEGN